MLGAGLECRRKVRLRLAVGLVGQAIMPGHGLLTLKHVGHRRLGWASVRRRITAAHREVQLLFSEQPPLTMPSTRRAAGGLGGKVGAGSLPLALPSWAAGPVPGARPYLVTHTSTLVWLPRSLAPGKEGLAWSQGQCTRRTTALGGMNSIQGQVAIATPS